MKIRALVQSELWLDRAGVRIRYRRIAPHLERLGASITVDAIDNLEGRWLIDDDVVILSKCTDARAMLAADFLRERGIVVGIDMFDDYFSPGISPVHKHREFLRELAPRVDFLLCSTERMREVAGQYAPGKPCHVLNDPFDNLDEERLAGRLEEKAARARADKRIDVLWFGTGDNPTFPVGLSDLAAYSEALQSLARAGFDVRLKVLTNVSALHAQSLARLRSIGLPLTIEEWSEQAEAQALDEALVSFLPVSHQNFSIAKSLNRGVSAMTGGTQILSAGFDLYGAIGALRYRQPANLMADIDSASLRLRPQTLPLLKQCMDSLADPANEARRLRDFLLHFRRPSLAGKTGGLTGPARVVLHGNRTPHAVQVFSRGREIASVGTPFCFTARKFDIYFDFKDGIGPLEIRIGEEGAGMIAPSMQSFIREVAHKERPYPFAMDLPDDPAGQSLRLLRPHMVKGRAGQMVHYSRVMDAIEQITRRLLPGATVYRSEQASPFMGLAHFDQAAGRNAGAQP